MRTIVRALLVAVATASLFGAVSAPASAQGIYRQTGCVQWSQERGCTLYQTCELVEATRSWSCWYYGPGGAGLPTRSGTY